MDAHHPVSSGVSTRHQQRAPRRVHARAPTRWRQSTSCAAWRTASQQQFGNLASSISAGNAKRAAGEHGCIQPLLVTSEVRTVAADKLWLSPRYQRETVCLLFTWQPRQPEVEALLVDLEDALARFRPRPHWGKLLAERADGIAARYPRLADFSRLKERLDPRGANTNDWFTTHVSRVA